MTAADPLAAILALGDHAARRRNLVGAAFAVATHLLASVGLAASLGAIRDVAHEMRSALRDALATTYEVEAEQPKPEPEPEPEPEAEPEPEPAPSLEPPPPPPKNEDPYDAPEKPPDPYDPPPAPMEAAPVLTADPATAGADAPSFVSGQGDGPGFGRVAADGTGTRPTYSRRAAVGGVTGGRGKGPPRPPPPPDRSQSAGHLGDGLWDCPFPPEADAQGIDRALVVLQITVRPDGRAQAVRVVSDPGNGFGREARSCAMKHRWRAARDRDGTPIAGTTAPLRVRFVR